MSSSQEFVVRVPREVNKSFNVMRFGAALNVDPNKWKSCQMFRENDLKDIKSENDSDIKEFGAGSEFGRKQKEEFKKKKYAKKGSGGQQPWILKTSGKPSKKYKGLREGGVSENASYYVFFQAPDGAFEAFPVKEWYNFTPIQRYKALTAEEAEEKFEKRDKILNYFSVMINKKKKDEEMGENSGESKVKVKRELKVSDMDDWHGMDSDNDRSDLDASDGDVKPKVKGKKKDTKKKTNKKKKKKGSDDDDDDSEPQEESDEGDFDDKEVDYMSDSSDSSEESETEKIDKEMKSVVDEDALRQLVLSEDEEEEEEKEENDKDKEGEKPQETEKNSNEGDKKSKFKDKLTANFDSPPPSSSDSDSDDPDSVDDRKSALLAPVKLESDKSSRGSSRSATPTALLDSGSGIESNKLKRKMNSHESPNVKRSKLSNDNSEGITEEAVRRYLMRKPMTCTDLLQKFKNKVSTKANLVQTMAQILKRLNPEKQTIKNKTYFSLKPT